MARRGSVLLMTVATVLGLWFGLSAPDVSPVAAPLPAAPAQPAVVVPAPEPVVSVPPVDDGPQRGGRRWAAGLPPELLHEERFAL